MSKAEIDFAIIVGAISALGLILGAVVTSLATRKAAEVASRAADRQIVLNSKSKIAEFRQAWINNLRDAMAKFMALGFDTSPTAREIVEMTAKIQLLMNKKDKRYPQLIEYMKEFYARITGGDQRYDSDAFVELCQDILKDEWEVLKKELLELRSAAGPAFRADSAF